MPSACSAAWPAGKIRYDNLKAAVARVLGFSRARVEADRWTAFRSHYDLKAFYCQPGITGAHEKGGVEGQVGWFRRNHLVSIPEVGSLAELNALVDQYDRDDEHRRIGGRAHTLGQAGIRCRAHGAQTAAGRAVRDRPMVHPARGPLRPGQCAWQ
ncbi:MAG: hypothetical protein WAX14_07565 [Rhodococcus sp. (in: high G+C Gram-positive bacteria)]|uniref:hypothetical protein n=1 Tax=Rhodococcus sp. TaxID=1831 RepID=UPI003BB5D31F